MLNVHFQTNKNQLLSVFVLARLILISTNYYIWTNDGDWNTNISNQRKISPISRCPHLISSFRVIWRVFTRFSSRFLRASPPHSSYKYRHLNLRVHGSLKCMILTTFCQPMQNKLWNFNQSGEFMCALFLINSYVYF